MALSSTTSKESPIAVGEEVVIHIGDREIPAVVIEDRGPLGIDDEQIVRIRVSRAEGGEPDEFEVGVSALTS